MIYDIESKKIDTVITKDMSRLGRDYIQTGYYIEKYFPENSIRYISLLDNIDTDIENSINDITPFKSLLNDMYSRDISKKIKSVKHDKQLNGLFIGGKAPYGYKICENKKNTIEIDEKAAEVVKKIFMMAVSGKSCREIAMQLNIENIKTPSEYAGINLSVKGKHAGNWSSEYISFMLKNQVYIGNMVQGRIKKASYKSKKCIKIPSDKWIIVENTHSPIIDKNIFERVQILLNNRVNTRFNTYDYTLKGLVFCHECKAPLGIIKRTLAGNKETLYFVCRTYQRFTKLKKCTCHNIRVEYVTNEVEKQIKEVFKTYCNKNELNKIAENEYRNINIENRLNNLKHKEFELQNNIYNMYNDKLCGILDEEDFCIIYKKIKEEKTLVKNKIEYLESEFNESFDTNILLEKFLNSISSNKELISSLIEKIEISQHKEIFIYFRFKQ